MDKSYIYTITDDSLRYTLSPRNEWMFPVETVKKNFLEFFFFNIEEWFL